MDVTDDKGHVDQLMATTRQFKATDKILFENIKNITTTSMLLNKQTYIHQKMQNTTGDTEGKKWYLYQEIVPKRVLLYTIVESKNGPRKSQLREKHTEKVIGNFNFYSRAVHPIMMAVIGKLAADQTQGTTETTADVAQLFDYGATHYGEK